MVAFPYVALLLLLLPLAGFTGLALTALAPAPLVATRIAARVGARPDRVGALAAATLAASAVLLLGGFTTRPLALNEAVIAFVIGTAIAGSLPTVRDAILPALDLARYVAAAVVLGLLVVTAAPSLNAFSFALALAVLLVGVGAALAVAMFLRADPLSAALGGGLRDPAVAGALAIAGAPADAAAVPLAYAILAAMALLALRLGQLVVRGEARREAPGEERRR